MIDYNEIYLKTEAFLKAKGKARDNAKTRSDRGKAGSEIQKELTEYTNRHIKPLFLKTDLLDELVEQFAKVELVYINGKVTAAATLKNMYDTHFNLLRAQMLLAIHPTRSAFYNDSHAHGVLVPLFMMAHKKYNGVAYEEWDKKDTGIRYAVGLTLWGAVKDWLERMPDVDDNLLELRQSIFESSTRANKTYAGYLSKVGKVEGITVPALTAIIKCQFWLANVENRSEFMILDTVNWDNMPDAFDDPRVVEEAIKEDNMYDFSDLDFLKENNK